MTREPINKYRIELLYHARLPKLHYGTRHIGPSMLKGVLWILAFTEGQMVTVHAIADRAGINQASAACALGALHAYGYIRKQGGDHDWQRYKVIWEKLAECPCKTPMHGRIMGVTPVGGRPRAEGSTRQYPRRKPRKGYPVMTEVVVDLVPGEPVVAFGAHDGGTELHNAIHGSPGNAAGNRQADARIR